MAALAAAAVAAQATLAQSRLHPVKAVAAVALKVSLAVAQKVVVTVTVAAVAERIPSVMRIAPTATANAVTRAHCLAASAVWAKKANV